MTKTIQTSVGPMLIRDDWDAAVIKEVIEEDQYRRWGDIQINKGEGMVLDLGAHIGSFSRLAASLGVGVAAFEPNEDNYQLLLENTRDLGVACFKDAVGEDGYVNLLVDRERNELHKVVDSVGKDTVQVHSRSLDSLIEWIGNPNIALLKMDIEGLEYEVLYGCKKLDQVKQITLEWHDGATKLAELIIYLEKNGFKVVWLGGNGIWGHLQLKRREL